MTLTLNLGFDRGNQRTNVAAISETGKFVEMDASSMVAIGDLKKHTLMAMGSGGFEGTNLNDIMVEYDGTVYFLSDLAFQGINPTTGFGDKNRYHSKHTQVSIMAYAALIANKLWAGHPSQDIAVNLVMGVPIKAYQEESAKIVQELTSSYRYSLNGKPVSIHIDTVKVFMEGAGAAVYQGFDGNNRIGIVDSGSLTTNILWFDGAKAIAEKCSSFEIGVETALKQLNMKFENKYGRNLSEPEKQQILRASIGQCEYPELYAGGKQISGTDLHEWAKTSIDETGNNKNAYISSLWSEEGGKVAHSFKKVYHVGGGAYYFHNSLQKIIEFAEVLPEAEKANARGYAVLANMIAQRKKNLKQA